MLESSAPKTNGKTYDWQVIASLALLVGIATLYFTFFAGRSYQATILDENNKPIWGIDIQLANGNAYSYTTEVGRDGLFIFPNLSQRTSYMLQAYKYDNSKSQMLFSVKQIRMNGDDIVASQWIMATRDYYHSNKISHEIRFPFDSSELTTEMVNLWILPQMVSHLKRSEKCLSIVVTGHTDENGSLEYNNQLGYDRALAAKERLIQLGAPRERIFTHSLGKRHPKISRTNDEENRRVEFIYYNNNQDNECSVLNLEKMTSEFDESYANEASPFPHSAGTHTDSKEGKQLPQIFGSRPISLF